MSSLLVHGACPHDCPDTCGVVTEVENGRAIRFVGDSANPVTRGWLCAKVRPYLDHIYHPERLLHPLRRVGPKGAGQWERMTWTHALAEISSRWTAIIREFGAEAILPYSYSGTLGLVQMTVSSARFWNRLGASQLQRSICGAAAEFAVEATLGRRWSQPYTDIVRSRLVIIWGHNPISTAPHFMPFLQEARHNGCQVVVIDPRRSQTAKSADWHLAPLPGSDGALAMGLAHLLKRYGLLDESWLNSQTIGWPALRDRIADFPPERVADLTGIAADEIIKLARLYGTTRPGLIKIADGINRNRNGGQNVRAVLALPAITGQYGTPGGGLAYSNSGVFKPWDAHAIHHWDDCPPPGRSVNMNRLGAALLGEINDPPVKSLFVFGANPAASTPNSARIVEGLKRDDLFTVVHELFMTDTADYADIVLPATSQLEQIDLHSSYGHSMLTYNHQAIPPLGECKSNWEVMSVLATAMGYDEPWLHQSPDEVIEDVISATAIRNPALRGITLAQLKAGSAVPLQMNSTTPFSDGIFPTPSGKVELFSQTFADVGYDPLPGNFVDAVDEPRGEGDWASATALWLVTPAAHHFVSSSLANQNGLLERSGEPSLEIHPADAAERGLQNGDLVCVRNQRGWCNLPVVVTENVRRGVVASPKGHWAKHNAGRNVNWTTPDDLADIAGQSTFHSNRVWVTKATAAADVNRSLASSAESLTS